MARKITDAAVEILRTGGEMSANLLRNGLVARGYNGSEAGLFVKEYVAGSIQDPRISCLDAFHFSLRDVPAERRRPPEDRYSWGTLETIDFPGQ